MNCAWILWFATDPTTLYRIRFWNNMRKSAIENRQRKILSHALTLIGLKLNKSLKNKYKTCLLPWKQNSLGNVGISPAFCTLLTLSKRNTSVHVELGLNSTTLSLNNCPMHTASFPPCWHVITTDKDGDHNWRLLPTEHKHVQEMHAVYCGSITKQPKKFLHPSLVPFYCACV